MKFKHVTIVVCLVILAIVIAGFCFGQEYRIGAGGTGVAIVAPEGTTVLNVERNGRTETYIIDNWGTIGGNSNWSADDEIPKRMSRDVLEPLDTSDLDYKPWKENP